jgi:glycosyltransferase involved in cell wall biosynthesis
MPLAKDNLSAKAMGGSELMKYALVDRMPKDLIDKFQIFVSRVHEPLRSDKIKIYWHQDLPGDPNAVEPLKNGGWKNFDLLVFNSTWQQTMFQQAFQIPYWKSVVLPNAIIPIEPHTKPDPKEKVNLIYHTTPHRGLELLVPVFEKLAEEDSDIVLDVYSSFNIYGWGERDKQYEALFERCKAHPQINYHGSVSNPEIREALKNAHIFAYPSIWTESSCIALIEAMSAGLVCVHSNLGALWDTSGQLTRIYQFDEDPNIHASIFHNILKAAIESVRTGQVDGETQFVKMYANTRFDWARRELEWKALLEAYVLMVEQNSPLINRNKSTDNIITFRTT